MPMGMGIVCENANFCGSESDFPQGGKNWLHGEQKNWGTQKKKKKKEAPVLSSAPDTHEAFRAR